jgi:hypothetical protein
MNTHSIGMKYYQKRYGLITFHAMGQQELHHIIWCMDRRPYYHGKLWPVSKEPDAKQSHPLEVEEAGRLKEKWFRNNYC